MPKAARAPRLVARPFQLRDTLAQVRNGSDRGDLGRVIAEFKPAKDIIGAPTAVRVVRNLDISISQALPRPRRRRRSLPRVPPAIITVRPVPARALATTAPAPNRRRSPSWTEGRFRAGVTKSLSRHAAPGATDPLFVETNARGDPRLATISGAESRADKRPLHRVTSLCN